MDFSEITKFLYYLFLMLSTLGYLASFFYGDKRLIPIFICLLTGMSCELIYELIYNDFFLVFGKKNNALFGHLYEWVAFFSLSYFLFKNVKSSFLKKTFIYTSISSILIGIAFQLQLDPYIFSSDPWLPFPLMINILIMSVLSLYDLLNHKNGYPFITIGIFLMSGCYLISTSVMGAYNDVELEVWEFRVLLFRIVWIMTYLLFIYELFLTIKSRNSKFTLTHDYE